MSRRATKPAVAVTEAATRRPVTVPNLAELCLGAPSARRGAPTGEFYALPPAEADEVGRDAITLAPIPAGAERDADDATFRLPFPETAARNADGSYKYRVYDAAGLWEWVKAPGRASDPVDRTPLLRSDWEALRDRYSSAAAHPTPPDATFRAPITTGLWPPGVPYVPPNARHVPYVPPNARLETAWAMHDAERVVDAIADGADPAPYARADGNGSMLALDLPAWMLAPILRAYVGLDVRALRAFVALNYYEAIGTRYPAVDWAGTMPWLETPLGRALERGENADPDALRLAGVLFRRYKAQGINYTVAEATQLLKLVFGTEGLESEASTRRVRYMRLFLSDPLFFRSIGKALDRASGFGSVGLQILQGLVESGVRMRQQEFEEVTSGTGWASARFAEWLFFRIWFAPAQRAAQVELDAFLDAVRSLGFRWPANLEYTMTESASMGRGLGLFPRGFDSSARPWLLALQQERIERAAENGAEAVATYRRGREDERARELTDRMRGARLDDDVRAATQLAEVQRQERNARLRREQVEYAMNRAQEAQAEAEAEADEVRT